MYRRLDHRSHHPCELLAEERRWTRARDTKCTASRFHNAYRDPQSHLEALSARRWYAPAPSASRLVASPTNVEENRWSHLAAGNAGCHSRCCAVSRCSFPPVIVGRDFRHSDFDTGQSMSTECRGTDPEDCEDKLGQFVRP